MTREQLVEAARAGDQAALIELLQICKPDLQRYARRTCSSADVDDAVQDALWIIYKRVGALKFATAFSGWLFRVVRNICLGLQRKAARFIALDDTASSQTHSATSIHTRIQLAEVLARLDPASRDVLLLRDVQGYSNDEAALHMGSSIGAAKSRLHRARSFVRAEFAKQRSRS